MSAQKSGEHNLRKQIEKNGLFSLAKGKLRVDVAEVLKYVGVAERRKAADFPAYPSGLGQQAVGFSCL